MDRVDAVVVGAGVIGLAVARGLALRGLETIVLEADAGIGNGTSSRNSEVIHAGIHDAPGSLKATLCVAGRRALYAYCEARGVGHRRCGKLVVAATAQQVDRLRGIERRALANGVEGLRWLSGAEARDLEPGLQGEAALLSATTGIVDSHALMLAYLGDLEHAGGGLVLRSPLARADIRGDGFVLQVGGTAPVEIAAGVLVNAAGLHAPSLARRLSGLEPMHIPETWFAKGNYYALTGRSPFSRLGSIPFRNRAAWACTSRSTWPSRRASGPTWNGSTSLRPRPSTTPSTPRAANGSTPPFAAIGPG